MSLVKCLVMERDGVELSTPEEINVNADLLMSSGISNPNGSVVLEDVKGTVNLDKIRSNSKDLMALSVQVAAVSIVSNNPNLSFFHDSFNSSDFVDPSSSNYELVAAEGLVRLTQAASLVATDSSVAQFQLGTFNNLEAFSDGQDGALRKVLISAPGQTLVNGFEDLSEVSTTGSGTQSQSTYPLSVSQGSASLQLNIDFSNASFTENSTTTVTLPTPIDISLDQLIKLSYLKQSTGLVNFQLQVEDALGQSFTYPSAALIPSNVFQTSSFLVSSIAAGNINFDLTQLKFIRLIVLESASGQTVLNYDGTSYVGTRGTVKVNSGSEVSQSFKVNSNAVVRRILLRLAIETTVTESLHVAIANFFGTTLGTGEILASSVTGTIAAYTIQLDNPVQLYVGVTYNILLKSTQPGPKSWLIQDTNIGGSYYPDGSAFVNNSSNGEDLFFALYSQPVIETIYFDNLLVEGNAVYSASGTFVSRPIDLGSTPVSLDELYWTQVVNLETITIRIRFASTEVGLAAQPWSGFFTDSTGTANNLAVVPRNRWYQYEVTISGGTTATTPEVKDVNLLYTLAGGGGTATVKSVQELTVGVPSSFVCIWSGLVGNGSINIFVSRDGGATWQGLIDADNGVQKTFTSGSGNSVVLRASLTGNAELYSWAIGTDKEFIT